MINNALGTVWHTAVKGIKAVITVEIRDYGVYCTN